MIKSLLLLLIVLVSLLLFLEWKRLNSRSVTVDTLSGHKSELLATSPASRPQLNIHDDYAISPLLVESATIIRPQLKSALYKINNGQPITGNDEIVFKDALWQAVRLCKQLEDYQINQSGRIGVE